MKALTGGRGVDTAIEAVGMPATFELCEDIVAPGRHHRQYRRARAKVDLHLETAVVAQHHDHHPAGRYRHHADAAQDGAVEEDRSEARLITHRFTLDRILEAYDTFGRAAEHTGAQGDHRGVTINAQGGVVSSFR